MIRLLSLILPLAAACLLGCGQAADNTPANTNSNEQGGGGSGSDPGRNTSAAGTNGTAGNSDHGHTHETVLDPPDVGDQPPLLLMAEWCNGDRVLLGDYQQKKVVLLWFFCQ